MKLVFVVLAFAILFGPVLAGREAITEVALEECSTCQIVSQAIIDFLSINGVDKIVQNDLDIICSKIPGTIQGKCYDYANKIASAIPMISYWMKKDEYDSYALCAVFNKCHYKCCQSAQPEQVHIALTGDSSQMAITWVASDTADSTVQYGLSSNALTSTVQSDFHTFTYGGWQGWVHDAVLNNLQPFTTYYYRVGGTVNGWSDIYSFKTYSDNFTDYAELPQTFLMIGDMGADPEAPNTVKILEEYALSKKASVLLHNGDISYADGIQKRMDIFMRQMQTTTANLPYMVTPGNHEVAITTLFNDSTFEHRFLMPLEANKNTALSKRYLSPFRNSRFEHVMGVSSRQAENLDNIYANFFYSFDHGLFHFIALDTESVMNVPLLTQKQLDWVKQDLQKAAANRKNRPWIIVYGHRPFYCSNPGEDCGSYAQYLLDKLEDLFMKYNVDVVFSAHKHSYERNLPVYKGQQVGNSYYYPKTPIYLVNGAGGNREGTTDFIQNPPSYSAARISQWGYNACTAFNSTVLQCNYMTSSDDRLQDMFFLTKNH
jgi:hypothetical protein